jgi:hypothetical protein
MTPESANTPPRYYWIVSGIALVWMLIGVATWVMDLMLTPAALAQMSEGQRYLYESRPAWITAVYAIATLSGLAGAVGLIMRRSWAVPAFAASLVAVVIQFGYTLFAMDAVGRIGAAAAIPFPVTIALIGAALLWFARRAAARGWLSDGHVPAIAVS